MTDLSFRVFYMFFIVCVYIYAERLKRAGIIYALLSLFISPLITGILLFCLGESKEEKQYGK